MPPLNAADRLQRLLSLVPWVVAHDGPPIEEVCSRFGCTEAELLADLELLFVCGVHPYTPDALIDVELSGGRVWIRYADYFARPLRLTATEGLALVAAGRTLLATPGADPDGPLARALAKVAATLGIEAGGALEVELAAARPSVLAVLRDAAGARRQVELSYYSYGRDEHTRRVVDPYRVFSAAGYWYLDAYCHTAREPRHFRVDRVEDATLLDATFEPGPGADDDGDLSVYEPRPDDPRVVLELVPAARWVAEQYPVEEVAELDGGQLRVRLVASERAWLERLLLRLGPEARVVEGDGATASEAACRLLARYGG